MKMLRLLILLTLWVGRPICFCAENKYDVLGKVLTPFFQVVTKQTKNPNRAFTLALQLEAMTDLPPQWKGARAEVALQYPDKLRLSGPVFGEQLIVCRNGQEIWAYPGSKVDALIEEARLAKKLPPPDKKVRLEPFSLPVPEKQLVLLPVLFQVADAGREEIDGETCRVLDVQLMPEIARSLGATEWMARLWVRPDYHPARVIVHRPGWLATVRVDDVQFAPALPESTWQPTPEQASDVAKISPARYQQLLKLIGGKAGGSS
jgi:hypothetical protein